MRGHEAARDRPLRGVARDTTEARRDGRKVDHRVVDAPASCGLAGCHTALRRAEQFTPWPIAGTGHGSWAVVHRLPRGTSREYPSRFPDAVAAALDGSKRPPSARSSPPLPPVSWGAWGHNSLVSLLSQPCIAAPRLKGALSLLSHDGVIAHEGRPRLRPLRFRSVSPRSGRASRGRPEVRTGTTESCWPRQALFVVSRHASGLPLASHRFLHRPPPDSDENGRNSWGFVRWVRVLLGALPKSPAKTLPNMVFSPVFFVPTAGLMPPTGHAEATATLHTAASRRAGRSSERTGRTPRRRSLRVAQSSSRPGGTPAHLEDGHTPWASSTASAACRDRRRSQSARRSGPSASAGSRRGRRSASRPAGCGHGCGEKSCRPNAHRVGQSPRLGASPVGLPLLGADVVGVDAGPARRFETLAHQADAGEELAEGLVTAAARYCRVAHAQLLWPASRRGGRTISPANRRSTRRELTRYGRRMPIVRSWSLRPNVSS